MSENRKWLAKAAVGVAVVFGLFILIVMRVAQLPGPEPPVDLREVQSEYTKTVLELHYADVTTAMDGRPFSLAMSCELRRGGGEGLVAQQAFTWTVPCMEAYTEEPVAAPITLTWAFSEPLTAGPYEEFCRIEAAGITGWVEGEPGQDGQGFSLVNKWTAGVNCYLPLVIKARR